MTGSSTRIRSCSFCVMDDTDPDIAYNARGECNHCRHAMARLVSEQFTDAVGRARRDRLIARIVGDGVGQDYDCILGVSGGMDSTYALLVAHQLGLRPLAVHLDNGWNSELAVSNIEKSIKSLNVDLVTHVVDWEEIKDLQRAFFIASLANIEVITDHAIFAILYLEAERRNIKWIISGSNVTTESIMPDSWGYDTRDSRHITSVHRRFGTVPLATFPILTPWHFLEIVMLGNVKIIPILNYETYDRARATEAVVDRLRWVPYARKHGESRFTRFFQEYYLPTKFRADKRKAHFSSMICSGQMTRAEAQQRLSEPLYTTDQLEDDLHFVTKKLGFTRSEWNAVMSAPRKTHRDYPSFNWMFSKRNVITPWIRRRAKGE